MRLVVAPGTWPAAHSFPRPAVLRRPATASRARHPQSHRLPLSEADPSQPNTQNARLRRHLPAASLRRTCLAAEWAGARVWPSQTALRPASGDLARRCRSYRSTENADQVVWTNARGGVMPSLCFWQPPPRTITSPSHSSGTPTLTSAPWPRHKAPESQHPRPLPQRARSPTAQALPTHAAALPRRVQAATAGRPPAAGRPRHRSGERPSQSS